MSPSDSFFHSCAGKQRLRIQDDRLEIFHHDQEGYVTLSLQLVLLFSFFICAPFRRKEEGEEQETSCGEYVGRQRTNPSLTPSPQRQIIIFSVYRTSERVVSFNYPGALITALVCARHAVWSYLSSSQKEQIKALSPFTLFPIRWVNIGLRGLRLVMGRFHFITSSVLLR